MDLVVLDKRLNYLVEEEQLQEGDQWHSFDSQKEGVWPS